MQRHKLGNTGLEVSRLGLGGIPFQYISQTETNELIQTSYNRGVNLFYTSRMYRDSENKIGLAVRNFRDQVVLGTSTHKRKKTEALAEARQSLSNFGVDYIDIYSLHNVLTLSVLNEIMSPAGAYHALEELRSAGYVRQVGISAHQPETILRALEMAAFDVVEFPLNYVDREATEGLMEELRRRGIGLVTIKPMVFGYAGDARLALRYIFSQKPEATIVGVYNLNELTENLDTEEAASSDGLVPRDDVLATIAESEKKCEKVFCRRCETCVVCPQGIDIRTILRWYEYFDRYHSWDWAREQYRTASPDLEACDNCGICERECPYHLPIKRVFSRAKVDLLPRRSPRRLMQKKLLGR
ncbi:MAG: aldo/keto reductase [Thermoleophilia bacterium]|nr:aldo/keto reductase [Thermoleophilia bacterium]